MKIAPCRRCGSTPCFKPYEQSNDGNHDTPASVTCLTCGRSTVMDWNLWFEVEEEVGDEKYAKPTAYLSARFMDALGDATIRKWNRENVGRPVTEHVCRIDESRADAMGNVPCERREEIVRCRDCGRAYRRGGGVYCSRVLQWGSNDRPAPLPVNPDGFCAWASRREDGQCRTLR